MLSEAVKAALSILTDHPLHLAAGVVLLTLSSAFSGCETSLFSLTAPELNRIRAGRGRLDRTIAELHAGLKPLLSILLFCNMAVNILFFSLAASLSNSISGRHGAGAAVFFNLLSIFAVLFFGEVFPKQMAIASSLAVARATAIPVWCCRLLLASPMRILDALSAACERMVADKRRDPLDIREEELRLLMEISKRDGVISDGEHELIDSVVELPGVRVRDIMTPRVDMHFLAPGATADEAIRLSRTRRRGKLPVLDAGNSDFSGWLDARDALFRSRDGAGNDIGDDGMLRPFRFFSEYDRVDQVLEKVKNANCELFAAVDERGQIVGFFTIGDVMDVVLGRTGDGESPADSVREEDGIFVAPGRLSVREWREFFGVSDILPRSATLGGLMTSMLGRVARPGDQVRMDNLELTVLSVRRNRIDEVRVRLADGDGAGAIGEGGGG